MGGVVTLRAEWVICIPNPAGVEGPLSVKCSANAAHLHAFNRNFSCLLCAGREGELSEVSEP